MNSGIIKRFFSGFVTLLFLFLMVMVQEATAVPVLKIDNQNGETVVKTEFKEGKENLGIFEAIEVIPPNPDPKPYRAFVFEDDIDDPMATEDIKVVEKSQVLFTYNSGSKALSVKSFPLSVPEPATMILFGSLLFIGFIGAKKGKKQS